MVEYHDIKWKQDEGFKYAISTGEEYYYEGVRNDQLVFECVYPGDFRWGGSKNVEWSQKGTWAARESWLTLEDAEHRHAMDLTERDLKDLE